MLLLPNFYQRPAPTLFCSLAATRRAAPSFQRAPIISLPGRLLWQAALEKVEAEIDELDAALLATGADAGKALELSEKRAAAAKFQEELYAEYERLDELVRRAAEAGLAL